ncbi:MAG: hypothetical protein ACOY46_02565 [Bacillota bacterium]
MARIIIKDLPKDVKISKEEMKKVFGGMTKTLLQGLDSNLQLNPDTLTLDSGLSTRIIKLDTPGTLIGKIE